MIFKLLSSQNDELMIEYYRINQNMFNKNEEPFLYSCELSLRLHFLIDETSRISVLQTEEQFRKIENGFKTPSDLTQLLQSKINYLFDSTVTYNNFEWFCYDYLLAST